MKTLYCSKEACRQIVDVLKSRDRDEDLQRCFEMALGALHESVEPSDDELLDLACTTKGCTNYACGGTVYCVTCLHGNPRELPGELAVRKLALEACDG
jgi:hypothetical protein